MGVVKKLKTITAKYCKLKHYPRAKRKNTYFQLLCEFSLEMCKLFDIKGSDQSFAVQEKLWGRLN